LGLHFSVNKRARAVRKRLARVRADLSGAAALCPPLVERRDTSLVTIIMQGAGAHCIDGRSADAIVKG